MKNRPAELWRIVYYPLILSSSAADAVTSRHLPALFVSGPLPRAPCVVTKCLVQFTCALLTLTVCTRKVGEAARAAGRDGFTFFSERQKYE